MNPDDGLVSTMEAFHLFPGFIELDRNVVFLFVSCCVFVVVFGLGFCFCFCLLFVVGRFVFSFQSCSFASHW